MASEADGELELGMDPIVRRRLLSWRIVAVRAGFGLDISCPCIENPDKADGACPLRTFTVSQEFVPSFVVSPEAS